MNPVRRVGNQIRSNHPYAYRSGEWATIIRYTSTGDKLCYLVEWPDGDTDTWALNDQPANYEYRESEATK